MGLKFQRLMPESLWSLYSFNWEIGKKTARICPNMTVLTEMRRSDGESL